MTIASQYNAAMADPKPNHKPQATFRLTSFAMDVIRRLSHRRGVSQAAIVEMAVRDMAEREGISIPPPDPKD